MGRHLPAAMFLKFFLRNRSAFFLAAILGLIISSAYFSSDMEVRLGISLASILAIWAGGSLLAAGKRWHLTFSITAAIALALQVVGHSSASPLALRIIRDLFLMAIFALCLFVVLKHALFRPEVRPFDRILASICGYFLLALLGADMFAIISQLDPEAFSLPSTDQAFDGRTTVYFSLITISTQGYGDIVPLSSLARIATGLFGAFGTIYLAVIVGAMVSSMASIRPSPHDD